jgi:hypothetical protein
MRTIQRTVAVTGVHIVLLASLAVFTARTGAAQAPAYAVLNSFQGSPDGANPLGGLVLGNDGTLYGTTDTGGTNQCYYGEPACGTVFALTPATGASWKETVIHSFAGSDGAFPNSGLAFGPTGSLFGVTPNGGSDGVGAIFTLKPPSVAGGAWTQTVLYSYGGRRYQQNEDPNGPLLIEPDGTLYTTAEGAPAEGVGALLGTVSALKPPAAQGGAWTEYVLHYFGDGGVLGGASGAQPLAGVVGAGGALFGTTYSAGDVYCSVFSCGLVFELTPPATHGGGWTFTVIYTFTGPPDGGFPAAVLTVGPGGVLYGTTAYGGPGACSSDGGVYQGCGTVFQLTPPAQAGGTWTESIIHGFIGNNGDGAYPTASLTLGKNGVIYGTTQNGGSDTSPCPSGCGTVFKLAPPATPEGPWTEKVLYAFSNQNGDGAYPTAGLALSPTGVLYGTTSAGGTAGLGTVFAIQP